MVALFSIATTIHAQNENENPAHTKEVLSSLTSHIRKMPQEQCEFRVAHIHIMANYFIATNAAIDITFTFIRFSLSLHLRFTYCIRSTIVLS